jgi:chromosome partitioning protein
LGHTEAGCIPPSLFMGQANVLSTNSEFIAPRKGIGGSLHLGKGNAIQKVQMGKVHPSGGSALSRGNATIILIGKCMNIVAAVSQKGGVGKTTTVVNLAGLLSEKSRVALLDMDPQGSTTWWMERSARPPFEVHRETGFDLLKQAKERIRCDWLLIDTPAFRNVEEMLPVIEVAHALILPSSPAPLDVTSTTRIAKQLKGVARYKVLLTKVDPRSVREAMDVLFELALVKIPYFRTFIRSYKAHERAASSGLPMNLLTGAYQRKALFDYWGVSNELVHWLDKP